MMHPQNWLTRQVTCGRRNPQGFRWFLPFCSVILDLLPVYLLQSRKWHYRECQCAAEGEMVSSYGPKQTALLSSTGRSCPARGMGLPPRSQVYPSLGKDHFL